jgi:membrane protein implicated in regulation of membrane protease activity
VLYGTAFIVTAILLAFGADEGGLWTLIYWPAACSLVIGLGYLGLGAGMLGKRPDGTRPAWSWVIFAPYYLFVWIAMKFLRGLSREDRYNEVAPGVYVGRRCEVEELPEGVSTVVDLTAELDVPKGIREATFYRTLPTLDGAAPDERQLRELVADVSSRPGPIYVHCAAGHARSALTAAAIVLHRGGANDAVEVMRAFRRARPRIGLSSPQWRLLQRLAAGSSDAGEARLGD